MAHPLLHTSSWSILALAASLAFIGRARAFELEKGPYLQQITRSSVYVVWETRNAAAGHVRYGLDPELAQRSPQSPADRHHELRLEGLSSGRSYYYALYEGQEARSEVYAFRTDAGPDMPFRFVLFGDNRAGDIAHQDVVDAILSEPGIAFVLNSGDMVSDGEVEEQWVRFFEIELMARLTVFAAIGNHEEHDGEVSIWERLFVNPTEASGTEHYYSFTYGNSRFVVLDGHVEVEPWYLCLLQLKPFDDCFNARQEGFVDQALGAASVDPHIEHTFVLTHVGPYSAKSSRTGSAQMRWHLPAFLEHGVDMVLSGHDHYYEHGISGNGIHYVISGGGGAPLYEVSPAFWNLFIPHQSIYAESLYHYVVVEVSADRIQVTTKSPEGEVIEQFVVGERPSCAVLEDCADEAPGACPGSWSCTPEGVCLWVCDPPPRCLSPEDCPDPPEGFCRGEWRCSGERSVPGQRPAAPCWPRGRSLVPMVASANVADHGGIGSGARRGDAEGEHHGHHRDHSS